MPAITKEEKLRRRQTVESTLGTNAMEGLFPDDPTLEILRDYEEGTLTLEQFSSAMDRHAESLVAARSTMVGAA